jgi:hypothetical protein
VHLPLLIERHIEETLHKRTRDVHLKLPLGLVRLGFSEVAQLAHLLISLTSLIVNCIGRLLYLRKASVSLNG